MKFALTQAFPCSYLPDRNEQLIVLAGSAAIDTRDYELLLKMGFRRSGEHVYRPHCPACQACQSLRIPVRQFKPSKSQKRILSKNRDIEHRISYQEQDAYYPLYEDYIASRHSEGSMYPPSTEQYRQFIRAPWGKVMFVELWQSSKLLGVAVTDETPQALSALYTFFAPEYGKRSLGKLAILKQIDIARLMHKPYLYLGYQIDACGKMNYKAEFQPNERFVAEQWQKAL